MAESENATKKGPFDNLDRDELIKKCKGLLTICKQAKQAKDGKKITRLIDDSQYRQ